MQIPTYNENRMEIDKIYNMDCLEGMKHIPDGSIDAIICDLPYGTTANKWDSIIPLDQLWAQYKRIIKKGGPIVLFGAQPFTSVLVASNLPWFRYEWIWHKDRGSNFANTAYMPMREHENIMVFGESGLIYNPQLQVRFGSGADRVKYKFNASSVSTNYSEGVQTVEGCKKTQDEMRVPSSVQFFPTDKGDDHFHPTQKPVDLLRYLIRTYSNEGDTILDNCMGSGTTAVACIKEKRHFIGFELNKQYYDKACQRISAEQRQLTLF